MIGAVVLAAGAASRFGAPKQELLIGDVLARLAASSVDEIVVVEGAHALDRARIDQLRAGVEVVECPEWAKGPGASLRCGLAAMSGDVEAVVVVLADGPDLAPEAVTRVIAGWREGGGELVAASYEGVRGHPLLLARSAWAGVPDEGFRWHEPLLVPCDDLGAPGDVDVPADLPERFR